MAALTHRFAPRHIISNLPTQASYSDLYQPTYPDIAALESAIEEVQKQRPLIRDIAEVHALRNRLAKLHAKGFVVVSGWCSEPYATRTADEMASFAMRDLSAVATGLAAADFDIGNSLHIRRLGQAIKPRSSENEVINAQRVASYMGDGINSIDSADRTPDPRRMVALADFAQQEHRALSAQAHTSIITASEQLLLPYTLAQVVVSDGQEYLSSAHLPWIGERTNAAPGRDRSDNPHVRALQGIVNPVGVKLGPSATANQIAWLTDQLNPGAETGKLVYMLRIGGDTASLERVAAAIREYAPQSLVLYDIHGSTLNRDGWKVRSVETTVQHALLAHRALQSHGLRLHGVHIESSGVDDLRECVETPDQLPTDKPLVDPLFNPEQLQAIVHGAAVGLAS
ncbi:hypothetical protein CR970_02935 [Candidatus Saccharibacteria bacterium]|nr:MAG: hypothetical protein CR970_02935 [Candidatus Saccharibacteria bacterium]